MGPRKVLAVILLFYAGEILVRRWLFAQLPTQIPGWLAYGVVAINLGLGAWLLEPGKPRRRRAPGEYGAVAS